MKYLSIVFILLFFSCKVNQQAKENNQNQMWSVESQKKYQDQKAVNIKITNKTKHDLVVFDPFLKDIESFNGEKWTKVNIPYCPCGNCPPPPETLIITSHSKHIFNWDKNIVTCKNGHKNNTKMESGLYRVTFNYAKTQNTRTYEKVIVEFEF